MTSLASSTHKPTLTDLSHLGLLRLTGTDAKKLLQGQLTCDLEEITSTQTRLGAHCNPQGRIISLFRLIAYGDSYLLQMPKELIPLASAALKKYAVFYKNLILDDATASFKQVGYEGPGLTQYFPVLPTALHAATLDDTVMIIKVGVSSERYELLYDTAQPNEKIAALLSGLSSDNHLELPWQHFNIADGIPAIYPETSEKFLPHDISLPALGGVSFKKGCYTGQEIIARMEYKGKLKKKSLRLQASTPTPPVRGTDIFAQGKSCGNIVDYCELRYNEYELLVIISESELTATLSLDPDQNYILTPLTGV